MVATINLIAVLAWWDCSLNARKRLNSVPTASAAEAPYVAEQVSENCHFTKSDGRVRSDLSEATSKQAGDA
jgi:hypothetical protein